MTNKIFIFILFFSMALSLKAQENDILSKIEDGSKIVVEAIPYINDVDKYNFDKESVKEVAIFLSKNEELKVEVNCFSDFVDSPFMNLMATSEQAIEIKEFLISLGVSENRINTHGNGDMFPIYSVEELESLPPGKRIQAELDNRRIEFRLEL